MNQQKNLSNYRQSINSASRGLWSGSLALLDFHDAMFSALKRGFEQAWREGAKECGVLPDERTKEEQDALDSMFSENLNYVLQFGYWILENNKEKGGKLNSVLSRAGLWVNRYNEVKSRAQLMACQDVKYRWQYGPTEHCKTCLKLNGRVYRASIWAKYNIYPQSRDLACHGYRCQCQFVQTSDPVTKGRPPKIP